MKKTYRSLFCLLAVLLLSVSVLPSASALFSKKLYYYGTVEGVSRTVEGKVESILVSAEEQETYQMIVTDSTVWQDHDEKTTSDPATLAVGEQICVVHDPAVMMSLPPQAISWRARAAPSLPPRRALRPLSWTAPRRPLPRQPNWWACCLPTIWPAPPCLSRPLLRAR